MQNDLSGEEFRTRKMTKFTLTMGPCVGIGDPAGDWDDTDMRGLKAVILCDTPSARMNCSRNSMLVRPLALVLVSIFWHN